MPLKFRIAMMLPAAALLLVWSGCNRGGDEAKHWDTTTGAPQQRLEDRTKLNQQAGAAPIFDARLLDEEANAKEKKVTVQVRVSGLHLVSPEQAPTPNDATNGFIEYRVDGGPPQYTNQTQFSVYNLTAGEKDISVRLVDTGRHPIGEEKHMKVRIPPM